VDALAGLFLYMVVRIPKGLAAKANGIGRAIARPSIAHVEALWVIPPIAFRARP
jgi:hypothetical protein